MLSLFELLNIFDGVQLDWEQGFLELVPIGDEGEVDVS